MPFEHTCALERALADALPGVPGASAVVTSASGELFASAAGLRSLANSAPFTPDTVCAIFSATKALTATLCLQLAEEGRLDLDAPARIHAPGLARAQVLTGFDSSGAPCLRAAEGEITTRMLLLHTAGFGYDFFNPTLSRFAREHGLRAILTGTRAALDAPLLFDPGEGWEYGIGMDWAGQVIEGVTGLPLAAAMQERLLDPLGMEDTGFRIRPHMRARLAKIHQRGKDGSLTSTDIELPAAPEVDMGGHGLYSTARDFAKFLRMWLAGGTGPLGRILKSETIKMASRSGLGAHRVHPLPGVRPNVSHDLDFFPGLPKSWGLSFLINEADAPTGRKAGSLAWAGVANVFYWIDPKSGIAGVWMAQVFPFLDPEALAGYLDFERATYDALTR